MYPVIALPPLDAGAVQVTTDDALATDPETPVGASGVVIGVTDADAVEAAEFPAALVAITVNVYAVPLVRPVNVQERDAVLMHDAGAVTAGDEVTVYPVIALPPLDAGAVQVTTDDALATDPETPVGASGVVIGVTDEELVENKPVPAAFVAATLNT